MRTEAEKLAEIRAIGNAMAEAVKARGPYQPADVIEAGLAMIVIMSEKLGADPHVTMAHLLLATCSDDASKAHEAIDLAALARQIVNSEERPS